MATMTFYARKNWNVTNNTATFSIKSGSAVSKMRDGDLSTYAELSWSNSSKDLYIMAYDFDFSALPAGCNIKTVQWHAKMHRNTKWDMFAYTECRKYTSGSYTTVQSGTVEFFTQGSSKTTNEKSGSAGTWTYSDLTTANDSKIDAGFTGLGIVFRFKHDVSGSNYCNLYEMWVTVEYEEKGYVSFDSVFSYKKWKDAGITGAARMTIDNPTDGGFSGVASGNDAYTANSHKIHLTAGTTYVLAYDISGGTSNEAFAFFHASESAGWDGTAAHMKNGYSTNLEFTPPSGYEWVAFRFDVNTSGETIHFRNIRVYPKGYEYMSTSLDIYDRTRYDSWSLPTPTRTGYNFDAWYTGLNGTGTKYTSSSSQPTVDTVLYSNWSIKTFQITSSAGTGGSITASATVNYGSSKTFTITPNTGYKISDVKVDGTSVGAVSIYTFSNVTATHTISATFEKNETKPYITSAALIFSAAQVSESNKVPAGQPFSIRIGIIEQ